jgi:hypothetical protein
VSDDELTGAIRAWDRVEAHAAARKHAAIAGLARRRPAPGCALKGEARLPECWDEFTGAELADALAESRQAAQTMLDLARDLAAKGKATFASVADHFRLPEEDVRRADRAVRPLLALGPGCPC